MGTRLASGGGTLATLVRQNQDLKPTTTATLSVEDLEAIAGAVGVGPSGRITWHSYYRAAARELAPEGEGVAIGWKSSAV